METECIISSLFETKTFQVSEAKLFLLFNLVYDLSLVHLTLSIQLLHVCMHDMYHMYGFCL